MSNRTLDDDEKNIIELIILGISMGIVHVLTGPDHLSALATLSANEDSLKAVTLGVRWGLGHSTGLLVVAFILIAISEESDIEESSAISHTMEFIVGVFMIFLGFYGLYKVYYNHAMEHNHQLLEPETQEDENISTIGFVKDDDEANITSSIFLSQTYHHQELFEQDVFEDVSINNDLENCEDVDLENEVNLEKEDNKSKESDSFDANEDNESSSITSRHSITFAFIYSSTPKWYRDLVQSPHITKLWAFLIGIIHGVAGPGGVLGVIPAVQLHNFLLATIYLGTFCLTSIVVMGLFALSYASCTNYLAKTCHITKFTIQLFSALLCIAVGVAWCVLILTGTMDHVFPD